MKQKFSFIIYSLIGFFSVSNAQVSLQSGASQISLPLYSYTDPHNRIGTEISLEYVSGNGLKVNEMASSVGTGWALNYGGVITRIQHGEADDQKQDLPYSNDYDQFGTGTYTQDYFPNGYLYSEFDPSIPVDDGAGYTRTTSSAFFEYKPRKKYLADREQDEFNFSFNGRSGTFVIGRNGEIKTSINSKLKFNTVLADMTASNIRTRISEFQITDESGIKYVFKDLELNELVKYDQIYSDNNQFQLFYGNSQPTNNWFQSKRIIYGRGIDQFVVSKWYLSEIINPLTNTKITFTYQTFDVDLNTSEAFQQSSTGTEASKSHSFIWLKMKGKSKRIKTITCSAKEKIEFNYSDLARADFPTDYALSSITVKYNGESKYSWQFAFGYFFSNEILSSEQSSYAYDPSQSRMVRLCLLSLQKKGNGISQPPYEFSYNLDHDIPANFSYYHDHWGYSNEYAIWYEGYALSAELQKSDLALPINNPQVYRAVSNNYAATGIIKTIKYPAGGSLSFEYEQNNGLDDNDNPVLLGGVRVKTTKLFDGEDHAKDFITEYKYIRESGVSSGWGYETFVYNTSIPIRIYKMEDGVNKPGMILSAIPSALHYTSLSSKILNPRAIKLYGAKPETVGFANAFIAGVVVSIILNYYLNILLDSFAPDYKDYNSVGAFSEPLNTSILPIQYSRVEVIPQSITDNNGKTVYEFTSNLNYPLNRPTQSFPYSAAPRYEYWKYGLPLTTSFYTKGGDILKKVEQVYTPISEAISDPDFVSQKWGANKKYFDDQDNTLSVTSTSDITHDFYYPLIGRMELTQSKEYNYKSTTEFALVTTNYEYSEDNYQVNKITSSNSKNETIELVTHFPSEYTASSVISLKDNNMLNIPVSVSSFIIKNGNKYQTSGTVNEYNTVTNGDIKLIKTFDFQSKTPLNKTGVNFDPATILPDNNYLENQAIQYNASGLPVQTTTTSEKACNIFGYSNKYITAQIINADVDQVAYTSFEDDDLGGWSLNPGSTKTISNLITGMKTCSGTITKTMPAGDYIVTLWGSGNCTVNGLSASNPTRLSKRDNSWQYLEWKLTNVSSIIVTADNMDEVRLYPVGAQMITTSYDPLIGKTSECDVNNNITYFQYDGLGRISLIRDKDFNVIRKLCYNYKGQPEDNCFIYSNEVLSGSYSRQDCPPGQVGIGYPVTIPEGIFIASSQVEANYQAQQYAQLQADLYGSCHVPPCDASNCLAPNSKCINGTCETGTLIVFGQSYDGSSCTTYYGYQFSDNSTFFSHSSTTAGPCN
jgi:hypothetical protein